MIRYRFAIGAAGILGLGAIIASTKVLGEAGKGKKEQDIRSTGLIQPIHQDRQFEMKFSECRFTGHPLVTYKTQKDETYFALQLQPKLQANARMPRDILLLVDSSASQAAAPLEISRKVAALFADNLQADDRLSIMTISNDSKQISRGFRKKEDAIASVKELAKEYASGGTNLKKGISDAVSSFESIAGRQRVLVFMGDGMSIAGPIDGADRAGLCKEMIGKEVVFFPVPIGSRMDPANLHGLASGTGGICMRMLPGDWVEDLHKRLQSAIEVPVLYSATLQLPKEVSEVYPSKLPPLRSDTPTLVVGKIEAGKTLEYKLEGKQLGKEVSLSVSEAIPVSEPENYFLLQVVQQWKNVKDTPALIQADRALAFAAEQNQVAVSDLKDKAQWALREDKFDAASRLFNQALEIDPQDGEAKNGSKMVQKLRDGKLTLEQIRKEVQPTKGETIVRIGAQGKKIRVPVAQVPVEKDAPEKPVLPAPAPNGPVAGINEGDILKETEARRAVADQQATQTVDEIIRNANRLVTRDPDGAYEMLKRILDTTQTNPDLSPKGQSNLVGRIERALQGVKREGRRVKSDQDERLQLLANADARSAQTKMVVNQQERISERMRVYHNLMNQARELEASKQANTIRQDMVNLGLPVPQAVNAAYTVGQRGFYLREMRDLQRLRDDKWLATLYEVERSHVPFPDEPEIVFPDASYYARRKEYKDWSDFSEKRKAKYGTSTFGDDAPLPRTIEIKNTLLKQVRWPGLKDGDFKLSEVLEQLSRVYNLEFDINEKAFAADGVMDVNSQIVASADKPLPPVNGSISTVLKKILGRIPAGSTATFLIRRESIEITTGAAAIAEKVVRIYPVADLVYPPPSAYNQQVGLQQATLYGQAGSFGLQQQAVQNQGFNNAILAGGIGAIGGGGGGQGALGGLGGGLGGAGLLGGQAGLGIGGGMAMAGNGGNFGQNGAVGQQGQMGNSGSQFGQQGGNSSDVLITIIRNVVGNGDKDWATAIAPPGAAAADPLADPAAGPEKNQIGFYSTANALVIKGTSRVHTNAYAPVINIGGAAAGMGALDKPKDGKVIVENKLDKNGKLIVAVPKLDPAKLKIDPQAYWQEALEKAGDNPSMVIAISDFLAMNRYFDHAADFLKANIRKGIVVKPWVYEALAIALRESGGSPAEIERAEVASIDLEPADGHGFLKAATTMAEMKRYTMALAFCKQAAHLEPNTSAPFEAAIKFAELADDTKAMDWAASNLMKQDWPADNKDLQELARIKSEALARKLKQSGNDQAQNAASIKEKGRRDLVIKLAWQGDADLDLQVKEPVGSICNPTNTQTVGGGVFLGDSLTEAGLETYTAAEAFKGNYEIRVKKVWGKTLGDKAQVRVIHNQGTAQQHEEIFSIDLTKNAPLVVKVNEGRRTELAYVSPPSLRPTSRSEKIRMVSKDVGTQLRDIADPEVTGFQRGTSIASGAIPIEMEAPAPSKNDGNDKILYQTRVQSFMKNAMDVTTQVVLSSDRRSMRVSVTPVFESTANIKPGATVVNSSVIPGGN
ncbi:MAG: VWA domain-containing protein [Gemmataceae bacterium]|nr:VWA domain-containing protein [Gemmataceae bacterium]